MYSSSTDLFHLHLIPSEFVGEGALDGSLPPVARQPVLPQLTAAIAAPYPVEAAVLDREQVGLVGLVIRINLILY